ncbi:hypothetical protein BGZ68_003940, partial [Mortierella alpina]
MSNPTNSSAPGIEGSANRALTPSLATRGRSASHGAATMQQANLSSDGDNRSISSQSVRKRDKFKNFFQPAKSKGKATAGTSETKIYDTPPATTEAKNMGYAGSSTKGTIVVTKAESTTDLTSACSNIFPSN